MFTVNREIVKGVAIGIGVSAVGFYAYKKNEEKVDAFMRRHGIEVKTKAADFREISIPDLMRAKEDIEDIIAEKEMEEDSITLTAEEAAAEE